jgi:hypothetical protein
MQCKSSDFSEEKFKPIIAALSSCASVLALIRGTVSASPCPICTKLTSSTYDMDDEGPLFLVGFSSMVFTTIANRIEETSDPWGRAPVKGFGVQKSHQTRRIIAICCKFFYPLNNIY